MNIQRSAFLKIKSSWPRIETSGLSARIARMLQVSRLREAFADALNKVFAAFSKDASGLPIARLSLPREMAGCIKENLRIPGWSFPSLVATDM
ncbi:hypothetical protein NSS95_13470 [Weizmannia sp. FSL K6-3076]